MCFAGITQIIKQIFHLSFLYLFIFVFILCTSTYIILVPTSDKHTPINVNNNEDNNNWIYNLSLNKKRETVLPIISMKDLTTNGMYKTTKIALIIMIIIAVLICCCCRKISSSSSYQVAPINDRRNTEDEYPNNNIEMVYFLPDI